MGQNTDQKPRSHHRQRSMAPETLNRLDATRNKIVGLSNFANDSQRHRQYQVVATQYMDDELPTVVTKTFRSAIIKFAPPMVLYAVMQLRIGTKVTPKIYDLRTGVLASCCRNAFESAGVPRQVAAFFSGGGWANLKRSPNVSAADQGMLLHFLCYARNLQDPNLPPPPPPTDIQLTWIHQLDDHVKAHGLVMGRPPEESPRPYATSYVGKPPTPCEGMNPAHHGPHVNPTHPTPEVREQIRAAFSPPVRSLTEFGTNGLSM